MENFKDKLEHIFYLQNLFDTELINSRNLKDIDKEEWIQKETLALISELSELLNEVNFKWWKNKKPINESNIKEELVDVLHFFISMCLKMNMTADELYNIYLKKNEENFKRQHGLSEKQGYQLK
jgi:dimeric dUTPase (all-alpha-NTP-PPase superfamily)